MTPARPTSPVLGLIGWIVVTFVAAAAGTIASLDAAPFYATLVRPSWAPPAAVFGPVWTALYLAMAVAAWLVWKERGFEGSRGALTLFVAQLACNALWSWLFFAWHHGGAALADIALLWVLVAATIAAFRRVRPLAAALLLPYLAWITFAAALNYAVWQRNPALLG
jgi:tryptophan-rich sensory protein